MDPLRSFWTGKNNCGLLTKVNEFTPPNLRLAKEAFMGHPAYQPGFGFFDYSRIVWQALEATKIVPDYGIGDSLPRINTPLYGDPDLYTEDYERFNELEDRIGALESEDDDDVLPPPLLPTPTGGNDKDIGSFLPIIMMIMMMM